MDKSPFKEEKKTEQIPSRPSTQVIVSDPPQSMQQVKQDDEPGDPNLSGDQPFSPAED